MNITDNHNLYTTCQLENGRRIRVNNRTGDIEEIGESALIPVPVSVVDSQDDTNVINPDEPPKLGESVDNLAELVRNKTYRTR